MIGFYRVFSLQKTGERRLSTAILQAKKKKKMRRTFKRRLILGIGLKT